MPKRSPVKPGRYRSEAIVKRIERMRAACHVEPKAIYDAIGMRQSAWSKKWSGSGSTFTVEELGAIADFFSTRTGTPLTGWPLVDVEVSTLLDEAAARAK